MRPTFFVWRGAGFAAVAIVFAAMAMAIGTCHYFALLTTTVAAEVMCLSPLIIISHRCECVVLTINGGAIISKS